MNNNDLLKAIGDIDDKYLIEENNVQETNRITSNKKVYIMKKLRYILAPICIIFVATIIVYKSGILTRNFDDENVDIPPKSDITVPEKDKWIIKEIESSEKNIGSTSETTVVPKWEEMAISQQFYEVEYKNNIYSSRETKILEDELFENIGDAVLTGRDTYNETVYSKNANLYSIKNISEECAIALQFEDDNDYYVYVNDFYKPETLGQFMNDLNLKNITSFGTISYKYLDELQDGSSEIVNVEFYDVNDDEIWQMLFNDENLENVYSDVDSWKYRSERFAFEIGISVDIPLLGYENISVSLTDKGYLITNILSTGKGFYIGEDKVKEFLEYISDNYDGYKIVMVSDKDDEETELKTDEEQQIVEYDRATNTVTNVTVNHTTDDENFTLPYNPMREE